MTALIRTIPMGQVKTETAVSNWKSLCKLGGVAALLIVVTALAEMAITFLPGGYTTVETVVDWFTLLHHGRRACEPGLVHAGCPPVLPTGAGRMTRCKLNR